MKHSLFLILAIITFSATAQNKSDRLEKFESTYQLSKERVNAQNMNFNFNLVYGNGEKKSLNTSNNTLKLTKSSSNGTVMLLSESKASVSLNGTTEDYNVTFDDSRKMIQISYFLNSGTNKNEIQIGIKPNGTVNMVMSNKHAKKLTWVGSFTN